MRILTCTPVAFGGGADFFARDSGLLCRGLQNIGIDSVAVMPQPGGPDDEPDLQRAAFEDLASAAWWRRQRADAVVLYAWGSPRFRRIAAAIRGSGAFLILNQDSSGLISPLAGWLGWWREQRNLSKGFPSFVLRIAKGLSRGLVVTDPLRVAHLRCGDVIACVSPQAAETYRSLCKVYGGESLASRVRVLPHPVETRFRHGESPKERRIACVGRWDDVVQKRPDLLMQVLQQLVCADAALRVDIIGAGTDRFGAWHRELPPEQRSRISLLGKTERGELASILRSSRILYSSSAFESFGIAAAEALCSGCSVVAQRSVSLPAFGWFVSEESGRLAESSAPAAHAEALADELAAWDRGYRCARSISATWCGRLHSDQVAGQVAAMVRAADPRPPC
jgi:glycosyltransferase involved in cell wall biosynthesis